jgi:hypothetical protein
MLDDPGARAKVEQVLHELLDRFMKDLKFHQRLVAALLITPETVDRVLKAVEREGAAKISELLLDESVREAMARGVNNAIVEFLARPVVSVLGAPGDESVENAKETVVRWFVDIARDPQTRGFAVEKLRVCWRARTAARGASCCGTCRPIARPTPSSRPHAASAQASSTGMRP